VPATFSSNTMSDTPAKVYRSADRITIAAPFPGLEPQDISVRVTDDAELFIHGRLRGTLKGDKEVLRDEWNPGPYRCRVGLGLPVDARLANVTYENGVVVVSLPIAAEMHAAELTLERIARTEGRHYGNAGHPVRPMTLEQHYQTRVLLHEAASVPLELDR
jgi:HSP20 family protein